MPTSSNLSVEMTVLIQFLNKKDITGYHLTARNSSERQSTSFFKFGTFFKSKVKTLIAFLLLFYDRITKH